MSHNEPRKTNNNPISRARIAKGYTQEQLAWAIGVDKRQISAWEHGRHKISMPMLQRIANALDVNIEILLEMPDAKKHSIIAVARHDNGYTQAELAKALGISQSMVSNYENGACQPTEEMLTKLSEFLEIPAEQLRTPREGQKRPI